MPDDKDEWLDEVDHLDRVVGRVRREEARARGAFVRVVNAFLVNVRGDLWVPRRTPFKRTFPGALDFSVGGHVDAGETYEAAFVREAREELRLDLRGGPWREVAALSPVADEVSAFMRVYEVRWDGDVPYNRRDFSGAEWMPLAELGRRLDAGEPAKPDLRALVARLRAEEGSSSSGSPFGQAAADLSFVPPGAHRRALTVELEHAAREGALGALLCGSVARGTASSASDLDLRLFWSRRRPFEEAVVDGVIVERHGHTLAEAEERLETHPLDLYAWTEGRLLLDPTGELGRLQSVAHHRLAAYRTPPEEKRALRRWLASARRKVEAAPDLEARVFVVHTTTWKLAEGVCAVNDRPGAPATLMREMLSSLPLQPPGWWPDVLLGSPEERVEAFVRTAAWLEARLA